MRRPTQARGVRNRIRTLVFAAAFCVGAVSAVAPAAAQSELRIATEGAYPPFNYAEKGEPAGFEVELGRALCAAMGLACTFQLQDWEGLLSGLKAGRFDAVMSSMEATRERKKRATFSKPYYRVPAALIGPKGAEPQAAGVPELAGRTVGTVAESEFATYLAGQPQVALKTYGKLEEANLDLLTGRIDYVLGDKLALSKFLESREGAGCCAFLGDLPVQRGPGIGVAVRRGDNGLAAMFDAALAAVVADGTYDRIRARYVPFDIK